jgi:succinate-semialdehyde dehydrogenase/glutarate-semialdehyde dehydrogenase
MREFSARLSAAKPGDPRSEETALGPLSSKTAADRLEDQVQRAIAAGAEVVIGGKRDGNYFEPTILAGIAPGEEASQEEFFGPVAQVYRVADVDEALELANATIFGLGSNVWTNDPAEQERFVRDMVAGAVFVNGMTTSFPDLPFGGVKTSGYGRELSAHGIREFCNVKAIWIN